MLHQTVRSFTLSFLILLLTQSTLHAQKRVHIDSVSEAKSTSKLMVLPVVCYGKESGLSVGTAANYTYHIKNDTSIRSSFTNAYGYYSLKKQYRISLENVCYFPREKYILKTFVSMGSFPDKYWGVGKHTQNESEENFSMKFLNIYLHGQKSLGNKFFIGGIYSYQNAMAVDYVPSKLFDKQVTGKAGYQVSGLGMSLSYDSRNNSFWPTKGSLYQVMATKFDKIIGSHYNYVNYSVDVRKFFKIYKEQILAIRAYGVFNLGKDIPVRSLGMLGGSDNLRGYYEGRFRDRNAMSLLAEYRVPVVGRFAFVAFGGIGDVANNVVGFSAADLKKSIGGGLRYALDKKEKMNVRFDYGFSGPQNKGYYVVFGEAF